MPATIRIPVKAQYRIEGGVVVRKSAEYADVPVNSIAKMIADAFRIPAKGEKA